MALSDTNGIPPFLSALGVKGVAPLIDIPIGEERRVQDKRGRENSTCGSGEIPSPTYFLPSLTSLPYY